MGMWGGVGVGGFGVEGVRLGVAREVLMSR